MGPKVVVGGAALTIPMQDGRRLPHAPGEPVELDRTSVDFRRMIDQRDPWIMRLVTVEETVSETEVISTDVPPTDPPESEGQPEDVVPDDSDDAGADGADGDADDTDDGVGEGEDEQPVEPVEDDEELNTEHLETLNAADLIQLMKEHEESGGSSRAIELIMEWEGSGKGRSTVISAAESVLDRINKR